ncbi:MAG: hypothetical protein RLO01_12585 [Thalassobaculaceae bacterium]
MWAMINNGTVSGVTKADPTGRHHPSLQWVAVPVAWQGLIEDGCRYSEGAFLPPALLTEAGAVDTDPVSGDPLPDIDWLAARSIAGIATFAAEARRKATLGADAIEIATWPAKEAMAQRHQAATATAGDAAALQAEADLRTMTVADLVTLILARADVFKLAGGKIKGWQAKCEAHVATEAAAGDVAALVDGLATLKAQAAAELETLLQQLQA